MPRKSIAIQTVAVQKKDAPILAQLEEPKKRGPKPKAAKEAATPKPEPEKKARVAKADLPAALRAAINAAVDSVLATTGKK